MDEAEKQVRDEAIRLRVEGRLSCSQIALRLQKSRKTVARWLRLHPLSNDELARQLGAAREAALLQASSQRGLPDMEAFGDLRNECIRLRQQERLPFREISFRTGASLGTLSGWLKPYPLTVEEEKLHLAIRRRPPRTKLRLPTSNLSKLVDENKLSRATKGRIAEAAVKLRLAMFGFDIYNPAHPDAKVDIVARPPSGKSTLNFQVRWAKSDSSVGLPVISLRRANGRTSSVRYSTQDYDFIVAYDFRTDTCYVFSHKETENNNFCISIHADFAEAWQKVLTIAGEI